MQEWQRLPRGWWGRLKAFCRKKWQHEPGDVFDVYDFTKISRRTFSDARKHNKITEVTFGTLVEKVGCDTPDELLKVLGPPVEDQTKWEKLLREYLPEVKRAGRRQQAREGRRPALTSRIGSGRITSVAVIPFLNLSGDPAQEYFADGITELLCDELGTVSALKKVISRTTVMQYKGTRKKLRRIAAELGVDAVVEGSVQRDASSVLVSAHLIDGRADQQLWAQNYERKITGLLKLRTDLARAIVSEIRVELTPGEQARLGRYKQVSPAALDAYLKGRFEYWSPAVDWSNMAKAEDYYKEAIASDPGWARAYSGLAEVYIGRMFRRGQRAESWLVKAQECVQRALALDNCLAEAHTTSAWAKMMHNWDWPGAEREICQAIQLNPSYSLAHTWYGHILNALGRFDEAAREMRRGHELDPRSPLIYTWLAEPAYLRGDYKQALEIARGLLNTSPSSVYAHFPVARVYLQQGKCQQAIATSLRLPARFWEVETDPVLARAYALSGRRAAALKALEQLKVGSESDAPPAYSLASVHTALGEEEQALMWLTRAYEDRSGPLYRLAVEPAFHRLHGNPRFHDLLKKMNLRITQSDSAGLPRMGRVEYVRAPLLPHVDQHV